MIDDPKQRWREISRQQLAASTADAAERVKVQASLAQDALKALLIRDMMWIDADQCEEFGKALLATAQMIKAARK